MPDGGDAGGHLIARTLTSRVQRNSGDSENLLAVAGATVAYQQHGSDVGRMGTLRRGNGDVQSGVPFIVNAVESCARESHARRTDVARCLDSSGSFATNQGGTVVAFHATQDPISGDVSPSLPTNRGSIGVSGRWGVRRLTPREAERLQGMPDDWTLVPVKRLKNPSKSAIVKLEGLGKLGWVDGDPWELAADGPRYRAIGNSMAVPCMSWIGRRLLAVDAILEATR